MPNADPRVALPIGERQYHIGLGPGELAEYILLPGDPDRTARIAARFDDVELERRNREFASVTGTYRGQRVSVVSTGIGTDNVEIVDRRDPRHHGPADVHPRRLVRRAAAGDRARGRDHHAPARSASSRRPATSSTTAIRPWPTTRRSSR